MKILIDDGMQIQVGTGIGKYSSHLLSGLKKLNNIEVELSSYKKGTGTQMKERIKYLHYINSRKFRKVLKNYDIVHFTNYAMPFTKISGVKYIVTIHDLVSYLYPETLPTFYRYYNRAMIKNSIKIADVIITVSDSVKNEICNHFQCQDKRITVIHPGMYDGITRKEDCIESSNDIFELLKHKKFFLFVGTIEKRKNVGMIINAFIELKDKCKEALNYKLVLAGRPGFGFEEFNQITTISKWSNDIIFTGYISDEDINHLYNSATAFIFPTVYEGFGSPQLECMTCRLPIILSNIPTNKEVSKDYGEFFDLDNIETLINKMKLFVMNEYDYASKDALADKYIKEYDWNTLAESYVEAYK